MLEALLGNSIMVFTASMIGILPVLLGIRPSEKSIDSALGFSGGVMLAVAFSVIQEVNFTLGQVFSFTLGFLMLWLLEASLPHEHLMKGYEGPARLKTRLKAAWLIAFSMIIHNIPEGMIVGSSTVANTLLGASVTIAIAIQDVVEGFMAGLPYILMGKGVKALLLALIAASAEAVASIITGLIGLTSSGILLFLDGFSSGAMVFIVVHEVLPEIHGEHASESTIGFLAGLITALILDAFI